METARQRLDMILRSSPTILIALEAIRSHCDVEAWIAAGAVRTAVWSHLHGMQRSSTGDIDVIFHDPTDLSRELELTIERLLMTQYPEYEWEVTNQARVHLWPGNAKFQMTQLLSVEDALRTYPETATCVAVRLDASGHLHVLAPYGLDDLFELKLRPAPGAPEEIFASRVRGKRWLHDWPGLQLCAPT